MPSPRRIAIAGSSWCGSRSIRAARAARSEPGGPSAAISARQARRHRTARNDPAPRRALDRLDGVEWDKDAALEAEMRRREAAQGDDLAVLARADLNDPPARAAHVHEIAGPNGGLVVARWWRNLHRASATRAQIVRRVRCAPPGIKKLRLASGRRAAQGQRRCHRARVVFIRQKAADDGFEAGLLGVAQTPLVAHGSCVRGGRRRRRRGRA